MHRKLAYIVSRFPHLPETFILRELSEMKNLGWSISLYPIVVQQQKLIHHDALQWIPEICSVPFISKKVLAANLEYLFISPGKYFSTWLSMVGENVTNFNFLARALVLFPKSVWMAKQILNEGIKHVHVHYASHPALAAWIIYRLTGIQYSITAHAHDIFVRKTMLGRKIQDAEFIIAISEYNRKYLAAEFGDWVTGKTHVIYCGIFPDFYSKNDSGKETKSDINPNLASHFDREINSCFTIVNIGSLQPYKGQSYLIRACDELKRRGISFKCLIIGEGALRKQLNVLIGQLSLIEFVELVGPKSQEEIAIILKMADCYIQPSVITPSGKMEGIPVSIMEAMICSVPVIATSISGVPEIVKNGVTGLLVPPESVDDLADAIETSYKDRPNAKKMALNAHDFVMQQFNLHSNVQQISLLMEKSIQNI